MPPIARPTQEFVAIDRIQDGVVILKDGALRQILLVSGTNFDLKSEDEKQLIIASYQNFLNSLKFSLQMIVHSRRVNVERYLARLGERSLTETNELLRNQIAEYSQFIRSFVGENPIMTKTFFAVVPFDPVSIPGAAAITRTGLFGFFKKSAPEAATADATRTLHDHIEQLSQRTTHIISGLQEIGLRAVPLQDQEITELLYNLYNPEPVEKTSVAEK